jgi:hypothetical protein
MRESSALAEGEMRRGREQLDLLRESLGVMRKQLDAFKEYQGEALAAPDLKVNVLIPPESTAQVTTTGGVVSNVSFVGQSVLCLVSVMNSGLATARNVVVILAATREAQLTGVSPWLRDVPSQDPELRLLRYQARPI